MTIELGAEVVHEAPPSPLFAVDTESDGIHNCRRCHTLVVWGVTSRGARARFDYPSGPDGYYINHHVTCASDPGKERTRNVLRPEDLTVGCDECELSIFRGGVLCKRHWGEFRMWISEMGRDAYTVWSRGERSDRRAVLLRWMELRR